MPISLQRSVPMTPEGEEELGGEIALLEQYRQQILNEREGGSSSSTEGALDRELAAVDEQLLLLRETLIHGSPIRNTGLTVGVGSEVTLEAEYGQVTFTIGGPIAATPRRGCISYESPLGQALLGAELGDWVEMPWENGSRKLRILGIRRGRLGSASGE